MIRSRPECRRGGRRRWARGPVVVGVVVGVVGVIAAMSCGPRVQRPVEGERVLQHRVAPGETLPQIADEYYGDPSRAREIRDFNLLDSGNVSPGQIIRVYMKPVDLEALQRRRRARGPYNAGLASTARGQYADAIRRFKKALELDPGFVEAAYNLGVAYQRLGAHDKAATELERVVRMRPSRATFQFALGTSYFHLGRYDRAVGAFRRAVDRDGTHLKALYALAESLDRAGRSAQARRAWRRYLELDPDSDWAEKARKRLELRGP